jgi:hypothetical protein
MRLCGMACFDFTVAPKFYDEILGKPGDGYNAVERIEEMLSTHPNSHNRAETVKKYFPEAYADLKKTCSHKH